MNSISASDAGLYRRWVICCTIGELVGFGGIPVLGGVFFLWATSGLEPGIQSMILYLVVVAGVLMGLTVGIVTGRAVVTFSREADARGVH